MKIQDDALKKLYRGYISSKIPRDRRQCPSPLALFACFTSSPSTRKKRAILAHITECSYCMEEFELLLQLQRYQLSLTEVIVDRPSTPLNSANTAHLRIERGLLRRLGYVIVGLALIIFSFLFIHQQKEYSEVQRARETTILPTSPIHTYLLGNPLIFRWQQQPGTQYYLIELFDSTLMPIWTSQKIFDNQIKLPNELLRQLQLGKNYFWIITAFSGTEKITESDLLSFSVVEK
jgi:hypothetical protein